MTNLVIRKLPFEFEGVEFIWNPANPAFAVMMNAITFQTIAFEKYICKTMNAAEKLARDPAITEEIRAFNAQEMIHSQAHRKYAKVLVEASPGLQEALDFCEADYKRLYAERDLKYHVSYCANIEATFTPLFGTIIEHRDLLFAGGDPRISSLFLWHFVEEREHQASAHTIYDAIVRNPLSRFLRLRSVFGHTWQLAEKIYAVFHENVPESRPYGLGDGVKAIPAPALKKMRNGILASQMPWHRPGSAKVPDYYGEWPARYESGEDMRTAYAA
ncbi:MAG: metal-dependent hydrolase [Alphaproteobacteria bacterium]|nr:metal-dependent hydrolase [Alphaproteobacteria bacterium]